ncbi:hypothetical protein, partial [Enterococcus hirae]|uniref:hypothetical protein n=1 Tax=Enterococcus hirae TaxID=1354 RepID=UPI001A96E8C1
CLKTTKNSRHFSRRLAIFCKIKIRHRLLRCCPGELLDATPLSFSLYQLLQVFTTFAKIEFLLKNPK